MPGDYSVYKHTAPSGKVYIGITCQNPLRRWNSGRGYKSSPHFYSAILKYGWDCFSHEILYTGLSKEEAEHLEIDLIAKYNSTDPACGYNQATGGGVNRGYHLTPERRAAISEEMKSRVIADETREKLRKANLGKRHTAESKEKMRAAKLGRRLSPETREKMRLSNRGKRNRRVVCVETGETFGSVTAAAVAKNLSHENISKVCRGKRETTGGYHWEFVTNEQEGHRAG